jgi:hypothetical protein
MDDLIYLIVLIAWVAFAFYRKSQKKSNATGQAAPKRQPGSEPMPLPTLDDILLGREPEPEPEPEPVPVPVTYVTDGIPPQLGKTAFEKEYNRLGINSVEQMDKPFVLTVNKTDEKQEEAILLEGAAKEEYRTWIDLRQAVIYSEILNRPYA